jgi:hypothetical protein
MVFHERLDRREFLALSALTATATLLPESALAAPSTETDLVSLQVTGDAQRGYGVAILYRGQTIAHHHQGGDFSAVFQNGERSLEDRIDDWKATSWRGSGRKLNLSGELKLTNLRTTVFVEVTYEIVSAQVIRQICSRCFTRCPVAWNRRPPRQSCGVSTMRIAKAARSMSIFLPPASAHTMA